jgi:hypothetical protein
MSEPDETDRDDDPKRGDGSDGQPRLRVTPAYDEDTEALAELERSTRWSRTMRQLLEGW